jgi:hypothetical protein
LIEVHLYGQLRRAAAQSGVHRPSVTWVGMEEGTVARVLEVLGLDRAEVGNVFINGRYTYAALDLTVRSGDRLGIFPTTMRMLYV